jgi:adenylate cyclase
MIRAQKDADLQKLGLGIGMCTGPAAVGNIGSENLMNYTVIGDVVNTAHRLVGIAEPGQVLFSATTHAKAMGKIKAGKLEDRTLPGKDSPMAIYSLQSIL